MRLFGIGLAVALAIGICAPNAALAKPKDAPTAGSVDPKMVAKGKAEAPALLAKSGANCTMTNARYIGDERDKKGKPVKTYYEVACQGALGVVLATDVTAPDKVEVHPCLELDRLIDGKPHPLACKLPENTNPLPYVQSLAQKGGQACTVKAYRYIGASPTNAFTEIACDNGAGWVMVTSSPPDVAKDVKLNTCMAYEPGGNLFCTLTDRASQLAVADRLITGANNGCTPTGRRFLFMTVDGSMYYEVACSNKKGYVLQQTKDGALARAIDCTEVTTGLLQGGCQLTDTVEAKTEKAGFYSTVATKAGFKCNVSEYALFNVSGAKEAVEVKCSDRPDGAVIVSTKDGSQVYNCALSLAEGFKCSLTPIETVYPVLTAQLKNFAVKSYNCNVDKVGAVLSDTAGTKRYIEVSCGVGEGVVVMAFKAGSNQLSEVVTCADIGGGCKLNKNGE